MIEQVNGYWVPSNDIHMKKWKSGARIMQNKCITKFLEYCDGQNLKFRTVLDIGAWCGTWSKVVKPYAEKVIAFEPDKLHFECLQKNLTTTCDLRQEAVGNKNKNVSLTEDDFTQAKRVIGDGDIKMVRIDDFKYKNVDLIKIDVEGYELEVLKGAKETLKKTNFVMIELNHNTKKYGSSNQECIDFLTQSGFKLWMKVWPDKIFQRIK